MLGAIVVAVALALTSPTPSASPSPDVNADATLVSPIRTISLQAAYTASSYGPAPYRATQIIPRISRFSIGKSLLRVSLPRIQTVNERDSSYGDMQLFYLFQNAGLNRRASYVGLFAQFPTGTGPLTTSKWLAGPAFAYIFSYVPKRRTLGVLVQTAFSIAGPKSAANQSVVTILPIATVRLTNGWFLKWPEAPWTFDLQRGATVIPVGIGIGRSGSLDGVPYLIALSDDTAAIHAHAPQAPKNTIRLYLTFLIRN